jgi:hypothetical protein
MICMILAHIKLDKFVLYSFYEKKHESLKLITKIILKVNLVVKPIITTKTCLRDQLIQIANILKVTFWRNYTDNGYRW